MVGLALGGIVGGWNGGILGGHQADAAEVAGECCLEGCGFMVVGYAFLGIILGAILGAVLGGLGGPLAEFAAPMSSRSHGTAVCRPRRQFLQLGIALHRKAEPREQVLGAVL
jgi:hypothetical protein